MGFDKKLYSNRILIMGRTGNTLFYSIKLLPLLCSEKWSLCGFKQHSIVGVPSSNLYSLILEDDQLDAQFLYFIINLVQSSTGFEQRRAHHQEVKLY